jgi:XTP/dITP diphosphohydrolase
MSECDTKRSIVLATYNQHKAAEIQQIAGSKLTIRALGPSEPRIHWVESGETFEENARIKARAVWQSVKGPVLADDSGLAVSYLNGAPGVYSSSYGGIEGDDQSNVARLLMELAMVPAEKRGAEFICCLLYIDEAGCERIFWGSCAGAIAMAPTGGNGFGYDPVFIPAGYHDTFGTLNPAVKNQLSHRKMALSAWLAHLNSRPR